MAEDAPKTQAPPAEEGPFRFGPYLLARRIGAGGMGEVYLAREEDPPRACVVKKVLPRLAENPHFVGRFRDEAKVVLRLSHPNIAQVYAMGEADGQLYLSMEYVQGKTLSRFCHRLRQKNRVMPLGLSLLLGERICRGLAYAHDARDLTGQPLQLVHRDLSPANVCISYDGEVKIIDFGAAQSTLKEQQTAPRVVIGNLTYMSPEQARKRFVDRRADVYAAGVMLWELLAWQALPQKGDPLERWRRAASPQWEPPSRKRAGLSAAVDALVARALAVNPDDRYPDAEALGDELRKLQAKLAPNLGDEDLGRLLSDVFAAEKKVEEGVLAQLLSPGAPDGLPTEVMMLPGFAPPTALAFEQRALASLEPLPSSLEPTREPLPPRADAEDALETLPLQGLDALEEHLDTLALPGLLEALEPRLVRELEGLMDEEASTAHFDSSSVAGRPYFAALAFLGACGLGFAVMWWIIRS